MITILTGARVYLALAVTDMRKGFDGLSMLAQTTLAQDPIVSFCLVIQLASTRRDRLKVLGDH